MREYLLETKNLKKQYVTKKGTADAVKGISFHVKKGEIFGYLGANGAGKFTTINMLTTQLLPSGGSIIYDGRDLTGKAQAIRCKIGVVALHNNLERHLTAEENLCFHGRYFGMDKADIKARSEELPRSSASMSGERTMSGAAPAAWHSASRSQGPCSTARKSSFLMSPPRASIRTTGRSSGIRCWR